MNRFRKTFCLVLAALVLPLSAALADEQTDALFSAAAAALLSPKQEALQTNTYALRTGETAYMPAVAPEITASDAEVPPTASKPTGSFETSNAAVLTVSADGLMAAVSPGEATVTYHAATGDETCAVTVSADALPEKIKAMVYVAKQEYYTDHRARLPKYNRYTKWYYGKKKEVGWCSVFTIWCANASGNRLVNEEDVSTVAPGETVFFREGQVGNQYDCYTKLNRFTGVPKAGYVVIYAELANGYRTTHIGVVVDAQDRGDGVYRVTTVEGNMSNTVKSYCYLYDSKADNHTVGVEKGKKLQKNMSVLPQSEQTDPLEQYELHTDHWCVFGFGASWQ